MPTREIIRITTIVYFTVQALKGIDKALAKSIPPMFFENDTNKEKS